MTHQPKHPGVYTLADDGQIVSGGIEGALAYAEAIANRAYQTNVLRRPQFRRCENDAE